MGAWTLCQFKEVLGKKERGGVFEKGGWYSNGHYVTTRKIKSLKKGKKPWGYYHLMHVYCKWQSNDLSLLRYEVRQTEFFVNFDPFLYFYLPPSPCPPPHPHLPTHRNNLKIKLLKKMENTQRYYYFTHVYHKWKSYGVWFLIYGVQRT